MSKNKPQRGDIVTCRTREEAYSSRYAGNPECWFEPADEGVVAAVDVPVVVSSKFRFQSDMVGQVEANRAEAAVISKGRNIPSRVGSQK